MDLLHTFHKYFKFYQSHKRYYLLIEHTVAIKKKLWEVCIIIFPSNHIQKKLLLFLIINKIKTLQMAELILNITYRFQRIKPFLNAHRIS